jgi:hypothetical protein
VHSSDGDIRSRGTDRIHHNSWVRKLPQGIVRTLTTPNAVFDTPRTPTYCAVADEPSSLLHALFRLLE